MGTRTMSRFFEPWPKIPRLFSECVVSEKLDGTNAQILIADARELEQGELETAKWDVERGTAILSDGMFFHVFSRKRQIWPGHDNFTFANWAFENSEQLIYTLGPGRHFGEWWGQGVGRRYGLEEKRFSLFNTHRWEWLNGAEHRAEAGLEKLALYCVPVLYSGPFGLEPLQAVISLLTMGGSLAVPGFRQPEGIVCYMRDSQAMFKYVIEGDAHKKEDDAKLLLP